MKRKRVSEYCVTKVICNCLCDREGGSSVSGLYPGRPVARPPPARAARRLPGLPAWLPACPPACLPACSCIAFGLRCGPRTRFIYDMAQRGAWPGPTHLLTPLPPPPPPGTRSRPGPNATTMTFVEQAQPPNAIPSPPCPMHRQSGMMPSGVLPTPSPPTRQERRQASQPNPRRLCLPPPGPPPPLAARTQCPYWQAQTFGSGSIWNA